MKCLEIHSNFTFSRAWPYLWTALLTYQMRRSFWTVLPTNHTRSWRMIAKSWESFSDALRHTSNIDQLCQDWSLLQRFRAISVKQLASRIPSHYKASESARPKHEYFLTLLCMTWWNSTWPWCISTPLMNEMRRSKAKATSLWRSEVVLFMM